MRVILFLILISLFFLSCEKDKPSINNDDVVQALDSIPNGKVKLNNFFPLSIGSYWVYEFKNHDANGNVTIINQTDTLRIIGDTIINYNTYFVFRSDFPNNNAISFRRTFNGDIISKNGNLICPFDSTYIAFYNNHYGKAGSDTTYHYWEEFGGYDHVTTPFGNYNCIIKTINHNYWPNFGVGLVVDTIYFSAIGMLQTSFSFSGGTKTVGTLVGYHLE